MTYYRGIKYDPKKLQAEKPVSLAGIYRGIKHDPIVAQKSVSASHGTYRGVAWQK